MCNQSMSPDLVKRLSGCRGVTHAVVLDEIDSTSLEARRRVADGSAGVGLVVVAGRQTAGRGRRGRPWVDVVDGNLAISVVTELPDVSSLLPLVAGLAVRDVLVALGVATSWKWPNDVRAIVDGTPRKCAGILVEVQPGPDGQDVGIVGIGVDVDWRGAQRDGDAQDWTSVAEALGAGVDVAALAVHLVTALCARLDDLGQNPDVVHREAASTCDTLGTRVRVEGERSVVVGTARALTPHGALVLDVDGTDVIVTAGDVVHLRDEPLSSG